MKKVKIKLEKNEIELIFKALNDLRNEQIKKGGITEPINELMMKLA